MSYSIFFHILIIIEPLLQSTQPVFIFLTYWIINVTVHEISKMLCQNLEKLYMYTHIHQQHQQPLYALIGNIFCVFLYHLPWSDRRVLVMYFLMIWDRFFSFMLFSCINTLPVICTIRIKKLWQLKKYFQQDGTHGILTKNENYGMVLQVDKEWHVCAHSMKYKVCLQNIKYK